MKQRISLPLLSTNSRHSSHTLSDRLTSHISLTPAQRHVYVNCSCSNQNFPSRLPLKIIKPELWQRLFNDKKRQDLPAKNNKSDGTTTSDEDDISLCNEIALLDQNSQKCCFLPPSIQTHIGHLHEQINDLTFQLSAQELEQKQTRIQTRKMLSNRLQEQDKQFKGILQRKLVDHENELQEQRKKDFNLFKEEQMKVLQREEQLKNQLEFLKTSFYKYQINSNDENGQKPLDEPRIRNRKHRL